MPAIQSADNDRIYMVFDNAILPNGWYIVLPMATVRGPYKTDKEALDALNSINATLLN